MAEGKILIARTSAVVLDEHGKRTWISKGQTAREGHPILEGREHMFRPLVVDYELGGEQPRGGQLEDEQHDPAQPGDEKTVHADDDEQDGDDQAADDQAADEPGSGDAPEPDAKPQAPRKTTTARTRAGR
jgi:hypothetical protein